MVGSVPDHKTQRNNVAGLPVTPEMLIRRALAEHLGDYGLQEVPPGVKVKNITEFLIHSGVLKPGTGEGELCLSSKSPRQGAL